MRENSYQKKLRIWTHFARTRKYTVKVYNYELITLKFVLINDGESNRKLPKMFAGKNFRMTQKKSVTRWFNSKKAKRGLLKIDAWNIKHKIILSWPNVGIKNLFVVLVIILRVGMTHSREVIRFDESHSFL